MAEVAVKREPSETASPTPNGVAPPRESGSIAETIETAVKEEIATDAKQEPAPVPSPLPERVGGSPASTNGAKKKAPAKKKSAIAKPKNAASKASKRAANGSIKADAGGAKLPTSAKPTESARGEDENMEEDDEDDEDGGVFCVCRGPDDHTWMIGCDGDCEDWFHGRCVNIAQSDADLIEKYICPNCFVKGKRQTTWKPMCRLDGCRKPARVNEPDPSKYCSDAHGEEYFRQRLMQKSRRSNGPPPPKKRQLERSENDSHQTHLYGGLLSRSEVKTLSDNTADQSEFSRLGDAMLPLGESNGLRAEDKGPTVTEINDQTCTPEESEHLKQVLDAAEKTRHSLKVLADKEKFLKIARAQAALKNAGSGGASADLKKKETFREVCGYDSRLAWNEEEFDTWRNSDEGREALAKEALPPPRTDNTAATDADGDSTMADNVVEDGGVRGESICQRKRCDQHKTWWKIHNQSIVFERNECYQRLEKLGDEALGIQERATVKKREEVGNGAMNGR